MDNVLLTTQAQNGNNIDKPSEATTSHLKFKKQCNRQWSAIDNNVCSGFDMFFVHTHSNEVHVA